MIAGLLKRALDPIVRTGDLTFRFADGGSIRLGDGVGEPVVAAFTDRRAPWALLLDPDLRTGELFTDGRLIMVEGSVYDLLYLLLSQEDDAAPSVSKSADLLDKVRDGLRKLLSRNDAAASRRNVQHHYDLDDRLYALFLDPRWQYSCAYFEHPGQSLADAQTAKLRHIAAKLALHGGESVLDIGCGWGGMACYLAATAGVGEVLGVTLSDEQIAGARRRAAAEGLDGRVKFELQDYRAVKGAFDRIVSVGMFEHVGLAHYDEFFGVCRERLAKDGVMLLHTIGVTDAPSLTNPWITKYIFPGGHLPSLSQIMPALERSGLMITDIEVLRLHYAETLRAWRMAFMRRREEAKALFDERFCRMWEYYLSMSETAFRCEGVVIFQLQVARSVDTLPRTRTYMTDAERSLAGAQSV